MRPGARSGATHVTDVLLTNPAGSSSCPRPPKRHVRDDESTNPVPETVITAPPAPGQLDGRRRATFQAALYEKGA